MKQVNLYICDPDSVYLSRLDGFIQRQESCPFRTRTFTKSEMLNSIQDSGGLLLIRESCLKEMDDPAGRFACVIRLSEDPGVGTSLHWEKDMPLRVAKYRSAKMVYQDILTISSHLLSDFVERDEGSMVSVPCFAAGFYASEAKKEAAGAAKEFARNQAQKGRCLFISLEEFPAAAETDAGLSDLLCRIKDGEGHTDEQLDPNLRSEESLQCLDPPACPYDLTEILDTDWSEWLKRLKNRGRFDAIVICFANVLPTPPILEALDKLCLVCTPDDRYKCEQFQKMLIFMGKERLERKTSIVRITGNESVL